MDKSAITMTADDDWWLERITMGGEQRYPERIRVGSLERPRVYVPERTCRYVYDEGLCGWVCSECGELEPVGNHVHYCPDCGARVVTADADR